jgi:hypothetical protein
MTLSLSLSLSPLKNHVLKSISSSLRDCINGQTYLINENLDEKTILLNKNKLRIQIRVKIDQGLVYSWPKVNDIF